MFYLLSFIIGLLSGAGILWLWHRSHTQTLTRHHDEKIQLLEDARQQMKHEFATLAQSILEEKSKKFTESNQQNMGQLIHPLKEQLKQFEQKIQDTYDKETRDRVGLIQEIKTLKSLNQQIAQDAVNLTQALKGERKTQGNWGEMILERVLEASGLTKGREYDTQVSLKNTSGKLYQPDVIVHLPEQKDIIVDSKVSLTAYERLQSCEDTEAELHLASHLQSIRTHIKSLSDKQYQQLEGIQTLDFVLMFVPIEPALTIAMQADTELFNEALSKNIVMVTPTTLLATLRTIQNIWRFEAQNQNALKIAQKAGDLYDKFVAFTEDMQDIGRKIDTTQKSYEAALNKLQSGRGNLVKRAEDLRTMGARASKKLADTIVLSSQDEDDEEEQASG